MSFFMPFKKCFSFLFKHPVQKNPVQNFPVEVSETEKTIMLTCEPFTMTGYERLWATLSATKYIVKNKIPGAFVECGVWRGGSSMVMAKTLLSLDDKDRKFFLYDTFEGMTMPSGFDLDVWGNSAETLLKKTEKSKGNSNNIFCIASLENVKQNFFSTGYPINLVKLIKGDVLEALDVEDNLPGQIALLRLDTDWYKSTKKELNVLFPRLVKGGVCIIDDYGHWKGSRKAVDEYFNDNGIYPLLHVTDYTGRVFIKL